MAKKITTVNKSTVKASKKPVAKNKPKKQSGNNNKDRIVQAIASLVVCGDDKPSRKVVMGIAQIKSDKSFANTIANMKIKEKLVAYDKDAIWLTEKGRGYVGEEALAPPENNEAMHDMLKDTLKGKKPKEIFDLLSNGEWWTRAEIADELGDDESKKGFKNAASTLSKLVEKKGGKSRLLDMCFPCGRPE